MPSARLREGMIRLAADGMVRYSSEGEHFIFLPKALLLAENAPQSPNTVKSWVSTFTDLPKTAFRDACLEHWLCLTQGMTDTLTYAFVKACPMVYPMPRAIQEQEQEQEQEQDRGGLGGTGVAPWNGRLIDQAGEVLAYFTKVTGATYPLRVRGKPSASAELVMARLRDGATFMDLRNVIVLKQDEWASDPKMAKFIRPSTLFRKSNYEEYHAAVPKPGEQR